MSVSPANARGRCGARPRFLVTSEQALFTYKCTAYYHPESERSVRWDDRRIGVAWPAADVQLSTKDRAGLPLDEMPPEFLPSYAP